MWNKFALVLIVSVFVFASCKTKRKIATPTQGTTSGIEAVHTESVKTFEMNNLDFYTFSGRAKMKVESGKTIQDVTMNVRIERDKAIWLSVTAILGVEVMRVLITPDSVRVLNKLQGEYLVKPFSYIYNYTNRDITFSTLQDLLMANVSTYLLRAADVQVASSAEEFIVVGMKDQLSYQYRINKDNRPFNFILQEVGGMQNLEVFYGNYVTTNGYNFPQDMTLTIVGDEVALKAQLDYNRVSFNEPVEIPFSVPSRYKVIK